MGNIKSLQCIICSRFFYKKESAYTCPLCGSEGTFDVWYDYPKIKKALNRKSLEANRDYSHWRYFPILPIKSLKSIPLQRVGWTPLYKPQLLAEKIGVKELYIKDDAVNPTASLKDRASSIAVAKAFEQGLKVITCASTGNAASSLAGLAASKGLKTFIFVPHTAPIAKITQLKIFGSNVFTVKGSYEEAFALSTLCAAEYKWYNRNSGINPFLIEGKKTVALEIAEQMKFKVPDIVFVAVGDGCTLAGVWKGFSELVKLGITDRMPQLVGVQAKGAAPIHHAWLKQKTLTPIIPDTIADSIAVGTPRSWRKALRAVEDSSGFFMTVSDEEILAAMAMLGNECGIFGEPAGVTGFAGLIKALRKKIIPGNLSAAIIVSGNGLKDVTNAQRAVSNPIEISSDYAALKKIIKNLI